MSRWRHLILLLLLAIFSLSLPGCSGCWEDPVARQQRLLKEEQERKEREREREQKKKEQKEDFEAKKLRIVPSDPATVQAFAKPGHWTVAKQPMVANNYDFRAEINSLATASRGEPVRLESLPQALATTRDARFPKGQWKEFELLYFVPRTNRGANVNARTFPVQNRMIATSSGREVFNHTEMLTEMMSYEYFMLVLASNPDDYGYLKLIHSTQPLANDGMSNAAISHYRVAVPPVESIVPVPSSALAWTSISVVVWDDLDPNKLSLVQQSAMLDWLHFGGQLIVSGPRSYATLKSSFLEEYLPVTEVESVNLAQEDFQELSNHWTIYGKKGKSPIIVPEKAPLLGLTMTPHPAAYSPPGCEELILERRIGRGRLCFTAFPLDADPIKNWPSFDSFVNAVLLRRPPRVYEEHPEGFGILLRYANEPYRRQRDDPQLNSLVRYFSRDIDELIQPKELTTFPEIAAESLDPAEGEASELPPIPLTPAKLEKADPRMVSWSSHAISGVAGWSDFSGTGVAARDILRQAAGISVPKVDFVWRVLALYLLVLAPLNWIVFKALGRVELAWVAAPIIAMIGAGVVIRMAQLDIGFARSQTDLAVLEVHEGYRRAHLTRYTALYTSLGTNYELKFSDSTALALPFSADAKYVTLAGHTTDVVNLERDKEVILSNLQINSNTTGMVHSEQMYDLGGPLTYNAQAGTVTNNTELILQEAAVLRRSAAGKLEIARLGRLDTASTKVLNFKPLSGYDYYGQTEEIFPPSEQRLAEEAVNIDGLLSLAVEQLRLFPEQVRLVAWSDDPLTGLTIRPAASQYVGRSMVLAHLAPAPLPAPMPDKNLRTDFKWENALTGGELDVLPTEPAEGEAAVP